MNEEIIPSTPLTIYLSKSYIIKNIGISIVFFVLLCYIIWRRTGFFLFNGESYTITFQSLFTILAIALSVLLGAYPLIHLFKKKPILTITKQGIVFHEKQYEAFGINEWKDIKAFEERGYTITSRDVLTFKEMVGAKALTMNGARRWRFTTNDFIAEVKTHELEYDLRSLKEMITNFITANHKE